MPRRLISCFTHRAWWWVFGLFIATPALVLALLGLQAIRAGEIEREQGLRDQQAQLARLVDSALASAFDQVAAEAVVAIDAAASEQPRVGAAAEDAANELVGFVVDDRGVISFPRDRVFFGPFGAAPALLSGRPPVSADLVILVDQAQAAEAQERDGEARALYERIRAHADLAPWASLRLAILDLEAGDRSRLSAVADSRLARSASRTPAGIPLALAAIGVISGVSADERAHFIPLITLTLTELRAGRWWLGIDQRRAYEAELRRWLTSADASIAPQGDDARVEQLMWLEPLVRRSFGEGGTLPSRADFIRADVGDALLVWSAPNETSPSWTGAAIVGHQLTTLFARTIDPLFTGHRFRTLLRNRRGTVIRGDLNGATEWQSTNLESLSEWQLAFTGASLPASGRVLSYATVFLPVVVLASGLVMTVWIVRRDIALVRLQSTFVAGVTHEFKSPITSIRLLMERLASGRLLPNDSPSRYYVAIGAETDRLEGLVNRLLESQKLQSGQKEYAFRPGSLEALTRVVIDRLRPQAEAKRIQVDMKVDEGIPNLALDRESMTDAIANLLDNAIKYSPAETTVSVAIGCSGDVVRFDVCDEGIGVEPSDADRIFDPFYRSRRGDRENVHGTGLGLSLVKAAVEAHGGSVEVESNGTRGSRFTLRLPVNDGTRVHAESRLSAVASGSARE
jgi:signal transduction histidine kinase